MKDVADVKIPYNSDYGPILPIFFLLLLSVCVCVWGGGDKILCIAANALFLYSLAICII